MRPVMITCPNTGIAVPTGLAMEDWLFRQFRGTDVLDPCPACGRTHHWDARASWLDQSIVERGS